MSVYETSITNPKKQLEFYKQLSEQSQQNNEKLKERIEYLERSNNRREDIILEQRQEISNLEDNWSKLREYIETIDKGCPPYEKEVVMLIIDKMQEIEQG